MTESSPAICGTCAACCRSYIVQVCGHDVWQLSRSLHLDPTQFVVPFPQNPPGLDGFVLHPTHPAFGLALDKQGILSPSSPCVFLMELPGNQFRCGVYKNRPVACKSYPMVLRDNVVLQHPNTLCPPSTWSEQDASRPAWYYALQHKRMHFDVYYEVVAQWNNVVLNTKGEFEYTFRQYFNYVMNVYDCLERLSNEFEEHRFAEMELNWGKNSGPLVNVEGSDRTIYRSSREFYLHRVQEIAGKIIAANN